jgi:hypothetical protein
MATLESLATLHTFTQYDPLMATHRPKSAASCTRSLDEHMTDVGLPLSVTPYLPLQLNTSSMILKRWQADGCNRFVTFRATDPRGVILGTLTLAFMQWRS